MLLPTSQGRAKNSLTAVLLKRLRRSEISAAARSFVASPIAISKGGLGYDRSTDYALKIKRATGARCRAPALGNRQCPTWAQVVWCAK